jgi:hypothetical protein
MYKLLYKSEQENVGIDLWYKYGKSNDPSIIFATGRHGKESKVSTPYIIQNINKNPEFLHDDKENIITGYFSAVSIYKNLILFAGNKAKTIEHSRLYKISPTTNVCTLLHTFIPDEDSNNFSARNGIVKDKIVVLGGTNGQVIIYNFDSKYNIISSKIINVSSKDNVVVGLCLNNNILSVGVRIPSFELNYIQDKDGNKICYPINNKFAKSAIIDLEGIRRIFEARDTAGLSSAQVPLKPGDNDIKYFTTNMQCTSIYHNNDYIICIGSGQKKYYSRCFYIPIKEDKSFGKKVILAICDGRSFIVINNNLFILCVTNKHIYIENFTNKDRKYYYIDNICSPCRGCVLYKNNKIIVSSIKGESYILDLSKINK